MEILFIWVTEDMPWKEGHVLWNVCLHIASIIYNLLFAVQLYYFHSY